MKIALYPGLSDEQWRGAGLENPDCEMKLLNDKEGEVCRLSVGAEVPEAGSKPGADESAQGAPRYGEVEVPAIGVLDVIFSVADARAICSLEGMARAGDTR